MCKAKQRGGATLRHRKQTRRSGRAGCLEWLRRGKAGAANGDKLFPLHLHLFQPVPAGSCTYVGIRQADRQTDRWNHLTKCLGSTQHVRKCNACVLKSVKMRLGSRRWSGSDSYMAADLEKSTMKPSFTHETFISPNSPCRTFEW